MNDQFLKCLLAAETDVRAFLRSVLRDASAEDDVFQETALVLWRRFPEYDSSRPFAAWARGIAAKKLLKMREQDARFPLTFSPEAIEAVLDAFDRVAAEPDSRRQAALQECLHRLPEKSRELIRRRYLEDRPPQQIAKESGRTVAAVYQALSRVRSLLDECIRARLAAWEGG
jgi:RNA polymerase sigma-70 factor (ECF subfamily)